ncbi:MAG: tyrosine-type recombinase/integrase [Lachnospiraceae bacterium]|nr:tyrosine-type recombinase/integrase [Lachnospiraceae bacterium]
MEKTEYEMQLESYLNYLKQEERSKATINQYRRDIFRFLSSLDTEVLTKEAAVAYKQKLEQKYRPVSVNTKLSALNSFFIFIRKKELCMKLLKIQRTAYCPAERELSREEYLRLVKAAEKRKNEKLALLLQTICSTGIRVSEVKYITVEAIDQGEALIRLKGKTRTILIPRKLQKNLKKFIHREKISSGPVFVTRTGRSLDRSNIWKMMKALCRDAGVDEKKVFPHNLRHLFARCFYSVDKDIAKLADILGHSSINTTRIYIISSGKEHRRCLDALGLVV